MNIKTLSLITLGLISVTGCSTLQSKTDSKGQLLSTYVSVGASGKATVRAISTESECPNINVDGVSEKMQLRFQPEANSSFEVRTCEHLLPKNSSRVQIENRTIPLVKNDPKRIVVIGDTGCRVKGKTKETAWVQNCNDAKIWPFQKVSELAAAMNPDLVIHVGDFLYRESSCPPGVKECEKSPSGDTWGSWNADLFTPAEKLLAVAPWIFARGNHESCARAGEGFLRLLDPNPYSPVCIDEPEPYTIQFDHLQLAVLDSSFKAASRERLDTLKPLHLKNAILITHRPLWGDEPSNELGPIEGVKTVFSGHWHVFHLSNFEDGRATQIVVGNSGTELIKNPRQNPVGTEIDGTRLKESNLIAKFGFAVLDRVSDHWELKEFNLKGELILKKKLRF